MATEKQLREFGRLICDVADGIPMSREAACEAYKQVILNEQPELQQGAFLMAHIARGPSVEELSGAWDALDRYDTAKIQDLEGGNVCDIVGTGSDALKTVNCSTPAALIAAACGLRIAKKGARLVTGVSGASDIMEILGIDLNAPLDQAEESLRQCGICYLPGEAFLRSGWARLIMSMRFTSAFNIIGPLTRPCHQTNSIVIGAYSPKVCDQLVEVLREIGMGSALAPYGMVPGIDPSKGMDEFSPCGKTRVVELKNGQVTTYDVVPEDFGIKPVAFEKITSKDTAMGNANTVLDVLKGEQEGPVVDFFCMNAAAALYIADHAKSYREGMALARETLSQGRAYDKLQELIRFQGAR
jgi:anthranilate phosphoribosyltransferase